MQVHVFVVAKKSDFNGDAACIALSASDPLTFETTRTFLDAMIVDRRVRSILLIVNGWAAPRYIELFRGNIFGLDAEVTRHEESSSVEMIATAVEKCRPTIALTFIESEGSASSELMYFWKPFFHIPRVYLVAEGWNGTGQRKEAFLTLKGHEFDEVWCNDQTAYRLLIGQLPLFAQRTFITGTPTLENLGLEHAVEYRTGGRESLGLCPEEIAILFLGDVVHDLIVAGFPVQPTINVRTLEKLIRGVGKVAQKHPSRKYAILVRPHGRADTSDTLALLQVGTSAGHGNLRILDASATKVAMLPVMFASDLIASINSTALHLAPARGRTAVFLGFTDEAGLGSEVLVGTYGSNFAEIIGGDARKKLVQSQGEFERVLSLAEPAATNIPPSRGGVTKELLERMFAGR